MSFANVELDRINGGLGLDINSAPADLDGKVLLCQYVVVTASGEVAVTDICGTRIFGNGGTGGSGTMPVPPIEYLIAQVSKYSNGVPLVGPAAVTAMAGVYAMIP